MKKFILLESRITDAAKFWKLKKESVEKLATLDPTPTKKYIGRILNWIDTLTVAVTDDYVKSLFGNDNGRRLLDDIKEALILFEKHKNNPALLDRDINSPMYANLDDILEILKDLVYGYKSPQEFVQIGLKKFPQSKLVFSDGNVAVVHLEDMASSIYYSAVQRQYAEKKRPRR